MNYYSVKVGNILIGGGAPIVAQSMCNTFTKDVDASVKQCLELAQVGAQLIRLTVPTLNDIEYLAQIKQILQDRGCNVPLVADIHFNSQIAIEAAKIVEKVRINPGNFAKEQDEAKSQFKKLIEVCKSYGTAIRIGINHGSLGERIIKLYGDTPNGMMQAALEWIEMCKENNFYNVVFSLKASNTVIMAQAYKLLAKEMEKMGTIFPLHLGVTEAGNSDMGRIKSAVGIASLLKYKIGNTIRVSLTESPVNEIPVAKEIINHFESGNYLQSLVIINKNLKDNKHTLNNYNCKSFDEFIIKASCDFGPLLLEREIDDFNISGSINNIPIPEEKLKDFKENLLQASRRKFSKPEYIACPGCGRTLYNLEETFNKVKERTSHLKGMVIAVMGCIVNGPGEMADADYGYIGEGKGKVAIYKGKTPVLRGVPESEAIDKLLEIIESNSKDS